MMTNAFPRPRKRAETAAGRRLMAQLDQLEASAEAGLIQIDEQHRLMVKHPRRVLWPQLGITLVDVMRYYVRMAPALLPHTKDRPLSFRRFAQGINGPSQFHQRIKWPTPPGVRAASFSGKGKCFETRLIAGDLPTLLYCVSLSIISQDVWLSRIDQPDRPDYAVFDLDPSPSLPFKRVMDVAWRLHELLDEHGVPHGVKTSGMSGLHVYVPVVNSDYKATRMFVTQFASTVAGRCPDMATVIRTIQRRGSRVYVDADQNMRAKTMAAPYSARHSRFAGVSTPVTWQELQNGARPEDFTILTMPARLRKVGDLWNSLDERPLDLGRLLTNA